MRSSRTKRKFDEQFKQEAVRLALSGQKTQTQVAQDLELDLSVLRRWIKAYREHPEQPFPGKGRARPEDEEVRRLQRELRIVQEERDVLKKALAVFSRAPR